VSWRVSARAILNMVMNMQELTIIVTILNSLKDTRPEVQLAQGETSMHKPMFKFEYVLCFDYLWPMGKLCEMSAGEIQR
jgi:hypothetical protein